MSSLVTCSNSRGQGLLEYAIVLPFLLIFFFMILEFSHMITRHQRMSTLSRESAYGSFVECAFLPWPAGTLTEQSAMTDAINDCLDQIRTEVEAFAQQMIPDFPGKGAIIVSLYGINPSSGMIELKGSVSGDGKNNFFTKYNVGNINQDLLLIFNHEMLAYGEVYYRNDPITPLQNLTKYIFPKEKYHASVF